MSSIRSGVILIVCAVLVLGGAGLLWAEGNPPATSIDLATRVGEFAISGLEAGDYLGMSLAAGDLNGDGFQDLIVAATNADGPGTGLCSGGQVGDRCTAGEVYIIYGDGKLSLVEGLLDADVTILGARAGDTTGRVLATGDVNGDSVDDLIIGAVWADPDGRNNAGAVYVLLGGPNLSPVIDLADGSADMIVLGADPNDHLGYSAAVGDINGDGIDDIIIGARLADGVGVGRCLDAGTGDRCDSGEAYVVFGRSDLPKVLDLHDTQPDVRLVGAAAGDQLSRYVGAGDVNGDGVDDILIGAYLAEAPGRADTGAAYILYGGELSGTVDLQTGADVTVFGRATGDYFGWTMALGDIDGDRSVDLLIGAPLADPGGLDRAGETVVFSNAAGLSGSIDLSSRDPDVIIRGVRELELSGFSLAIGDLNGDGAGDAIVSAIWAAPSGRRQAGETYVVYGGAGIGPIVDLDGGSGPSFQGAEAGDWSGWALLVANLNGDSLDDLALSAFSANPGGRDGAGQVYLFLGEQGFDIGDVDRNGDVNSIDAMLVLQLSAGMIGTLPQFELQDVNGDGAVDSQDALLILQFVAGLVESLKAGG